MSNGSLSRSQLATYAVEDIPRIVEELTKTNPEGGVVVRDVAAKTWGINATYVGWATLLQKKDHGLFQQVKLGKITLRKAMDQYHAKNGKTKGAQAIKGLWTNADYNRAEFYLGRITAVPENLEKINVDAIKSNVLLCQHWVDACKRAKCALSNIQKLLEEK